MYILGKKLNFILVFWFLFYFLLFGFLLRNSFSYLDPDLGWHLRVGEAIAQTSTVPHANTYNYTFNGNWVDHEWLINYISFIIYDKFGYLALNIFFALIIILSFVLLNILTRKFSAKTSEGLMFFLQLFGLIACLPHFGIRMQEFGFLFFILELWIIFSFIKKRQIKNLFWLLPLFFLWANVHGSFLLGLGIILSYPLAKLIERYLIPKKIKKYFDLSGPITGREIKVFFGLFLGASFLTLFTPYGLEFYSFLGSYSNTFYLQAIQEWRPQLTFPFNYWQLGYLALMVIILVLYFFNLLKAKKTKIDLWQLGLVFLFLFLSFKSRRHFPLLLSATFIFVYQTIYELFNLAELKFWPIKTKIKYLILLCLGLSGLNQYASLEIFQDPFNRFCSDFPCQAVKFLKQEKKYQDANIFNEYNWGGYLIWSYPSRKLFIDGRMPQIQYAGHSFLEEYTDFLRPSADYNHKLSQYKIELVLLKTEDSKNKATAWEKSFFLIKDEDLIVKNYLRRHLENDSAWQKIYTDSVASIYAKIK